MTFSAAQRTKEIGVRKVLGASVTSILGLLGKEFIWLIVIAFCIAAPLAFWLMNRWLGSFAYRVNISSDVFIATLVVTFVIAGLTIAHQALKAALMNPVKSLKAD
ncbi:FtsX-like permease family protein [Chitinophaga sedimenti]|uniref:ABC transporter permease n=1 Tax=Chitinophaga sedimenti TaxID=2033606 RepID=UPI0020046C3B|nr:FtsX-like permease family protein [Chitinophaga sedimenti]MCK7555312.1 FtsX-like permease family protein [Chitinophaga sedimenti]